MIRHALVLLGYWIRPYDLHLDARRWRWQRSGRQRSNAAWAALSEQDRNAILDAARRRLREQRGPEQEGP